MYNGKIFGMDPRLVVVFVWPILELGAVFLCFNYLILPKIAEIKNAYNQIASLKSQMTDIRQKRSFMVSVDEVDLKQKLAVVNQALLANADSYLLVSYIDKVAQQSGFDISSFSTSPGKVVDNASDSGSKKGSTSSVSIKATLVGPSDKYVDLFTSMENTLPLISISSLKMTTNNGLVSLDLEASGTLAGILAPKDYEKIAINDLKITTKETELLNQLAGYKNLGEGETTISNFVEYNRTNPFSF